MNDSERSLSLSMTIFDVSSQQENSVTVDFTDVTTIREYDGVRLCKALQDGYRCTLRSATGSEAIASERKSFERGQPGLLPNVLRSWYAMSGGDTGTMHFMYDHFDMDLEQYAKKVGEIIDSEGVMKPEFMEIMRYTFGTLQYLHTRGNQSHGNLKWDDNGRCPLNIVVIKDVGGLPIVKFTGLGDQEKDSPEARSQDCQHLADILPTLVQKYSADNVILPFWFQAMMRHLRTWGCERLDESIIFLEPRMKLNYIYSVYRHVAQNNMYDAVDEHMSNLMCEFSRHGGNWTSHVTSNPKFSYIFRLHSGGISYAKIAACFLRYCGRYCGNIISDYNDALSWSPVRLVRTDVPFSDHYEELYSMWPEFFDLLPETLAKHDISSTYWSM